MKAGQRSSAKYFHVNFLLWYYGLCLREKQIPLVVCTCTAPTKGCWWTQYECPNKVLSLLCGQQCHPYVPRVSSLMALKYCVRKKPSVPLTVSYQWVLYNQHVIWKMREPTFNIALSAKYDQIGFQFSSAHTHPLLLSDYFASINQ